MESKKQSFGPVAVTLTVLAALVRLIPHPPNFAPVGGLAIFGGARLKGWQAYCVPLLAMLVTDPIRSWMEGGFAPYSRTSIVVYGCFLISVWLGRRLIGESTNLVRIGSVTLLGSFQFFAFTNLSVWWFATDLYPHTISGLLACYVAAIPFLGRSVVADLFYAGVLFGAYQLTRQSTLRRARTQAAA
jgi:hypothetical protein